MDIGVKYKYYPVIQRDTDFYTQPTSAISRLIIDIVKTEYPVHVEDLVLRVKQCWGFKKAGKPIRSKIEMALEAAYRSADIILKDNFLYFKDANKCPLDFPIRKRDYPDSAQNPLYIPKEEYIAASVLILKEYGDLSEDGLIKKVSLLFGFKRLGSQLNAYISSAIQDAVKKSLIQKSDTNTYFYAAYDHYLFRDSSKQ
ncbi:MAG: DUF3320 domain-containing protein [Candidatus Auribacterota bacterium]